MGSNVRQYKRRFFVLKPSTHLYYFLSPNDVEPRGCIDLDSPDTAVKEVGSLPDGRFRFEITVGRGGSRADAFKEKVSSIDCDGAHGGAMVTSHNQRIVLEARSEDVGREWMRSLDRERLGYARSEAEAARVDAEGLKSRVAELEARVGELRLAERDRDGAIKDAADWRDKFRKLDEAIQILTRWVGRPPEVEVGRRPFPEKEGVGKDMDGAAMAAGNLERNGNKKKGDSATMDENYSGSDAKAALAKDGLRGKSEDTSSTLNSSGSGSASILSSNSIDLSALVGLSYEDLQLDQIDVAGSHFPSLNNGCRRVRDNLRHTSIEANEAVQDLIAANTKVKVVEKRMDRAEQELCKLWEENCDLRDALKKARRERRVLVREVRSMREGTTNVATRPYREEEKEETRHSLGAEERRGLSNHMEGPFDGATNDLDMLPHIFTASSEECYSESPQYSLAQSMPASVPTSHFVRTPIIQNKSPAAKKKLGSEGQKLILELEEHVMAGLRLHEQFVASSDGPLVMQFTEKANFMEVLSSEPLLEPSVAEGSKRTVDEAEWERTKKKEGEDYTHSPMFPTKLSLMDIENDGDASSSATTEAPLIEYEKADMSSLRRARDGPNGYRNANNSNVSLSGNGEGQSVDVDGISGMYTKELRVQVLSEHDDSTDTEHRRKHPILQLDKDADDADSAAPPILCPSSTQSECSTKSMITDTGKATARLTCPFNDVVPTSGQQDLLDNGEFSGEKVEIYHLTFYSRKIGLQFQKVPMASPSVGTLTDAMTVDVSVNAGMVENAEAAELRRVAALTKRAQCQHSNFLNKEAEPSMQVAAPADTVLICGFHGFDDAGDSRERPRLGARLVAFDGVSVEIGRWTFESVRKAIQARGRPLTLSFRNDYLTTIQRSILTRAVQEMESNLPPPRPIFQCKMEGPKISQDLKNEQQQEVIPVGNHFLGRDSTKASFTHTQQSYQNREFLPPKSELTSFSEVGSTTGSVFPSALGPLMSGLISGVSKSEFQQPPIKEIPAAPEYLKRNETESVDFVRKHQEFTAGLL